MDYPFTAEQRLLAVQLNIRFLANISTESASSHISENIQYSHWPHWGTWLALRQTLLQVCCLLYARTII